ncbi:hypothetical protein [Nocardia mexicana]|uniref:Uncharacterized protein n=1 Tax=Nocardia mexicana TaxID=279262 RepID=A0A370H8R5_9NOCA|nr:hypothetical protein [Nocardia mexicana]RDI53065.1 hypothetical protein DFR68_103453 [Nocardia mexicana]
MNHRGRAAVLAGFAGSAALFGTGVGTADTPPNDIASTNSAEDSQFATGSSHYKTAAALPNWLRHIIEQLQRSP